MYARGSSIFRNSSGRGRLDIALAVATAFQAPGIPGPNLGCPSDSNPRDVVNVLDSVTTSLALDRPRDLCVNDAAKASPGAAGDLLHRHRLQR
jgi:hypothetical protein